MKPNYFECSCQSSEHTLKFVYNADDNELYTEVYLNQTNNPIKRIWIAIKYIFGYTSKYGHWDCFIMQAKDKQRMLNTIRQLKG